MTERKRAVKNMAGEERFDLEVLLKWIKLKYFLRILTQKLYKVTPKFQVTSIHLLATSYHQLLVTSFQRKVTSFQTEVSLNKARFFPKFEVKECLVCFECSSYKIHTILSIALGYDAKIKTRLLAFLSKQARSFC